MVDSFYQVGRIESEVARVEIQYRGCCRAVAKTNLDAHPEVKCRFLFGANAVELQPVEGRTSYFWCDHDMAMGVEPAKQAHSGVVETVFQGIV